VKTNLKIFSSCAYILEKLQQFRVFSNETINCLSFFTYSFIFFSKSFFRFTLSQVISSLFLPPLFFLLSFLIFFSSFFLFIYYFLIFFYFLLPSFLLFSVFSSILPFVFKQCINGYRKSSTTLIGRPPQLFSNPVNFFFSDAPQEVIYKIINFVKVRRSKHP
jgi:hypothetical protein